MNIRYALLFVLVVLVAACNKFDNLTVDWQPDVAATLFNTSINTVDLFEQYGDDTELIIDTDQRLTLVYKSDGYSVESRDILSLIPDVNFPMLDTFLQLPYPLPVDVTIDYIIAKSGEIKFTTANFHDEPMEFTVTIPEATLNGAPFSKTVTVPARGPLPAWPSENTYPLADYTLTPASDSMIFRYSARLLDSDSLVVLPAVVVDFINPAYTYAEGFLGTGSFPIPVDSVEVDFFKYFSGGSVFFEEPKMTIRTQNSFGFPVRASFNQLNAINEDGTTIPFGSTELTNGVDFNYPSLSEVGEAKETVIVIDKDNSNIEDIIGQPVIYFEYDVDVTSNPDNDMSITSFVTDTSSFYLDAEVELPLYGRADGFVVKDTLDFELGDVENVEAVEFKLVTENGFPVDVDLQIDFLDENGAVVDRLMNPAEQIFAAGEVGADGRVSAPTRQETFITIPAERFTAIQQNAKRVAIEAKISTYSDGDTSVRIYEDYTMDIRLGVIAGLEL